MSTGGEKVFQRATRALARATLRRGESPPVDVRGLKRVLVVHVDNRPEGVLLATPLLRALREGMPHVRLDWLLADGPRPLVDALFLVDRLISYDAGRAPGLGVPSLLSRLRASEYDAVLDASPDDAFNLSGAMITRWSGAPVRIGHERGDAAHFYSHPVPLPEGPCAESRVKLSLLAPLGLPERGTLLETSAGLAADAVARAEAVLASLELASRRYFVVGAGGGERRQPAALVAEVLRRLANATGQRALVVWEEGDEDHARSIVEAARPAALLAPACDVQVHAALLRRASLVLADDAGPLALAGACATPTVALLPEAVAGRRAIPLPSFRAVSTDRDAVEVSTQAVSAARELLGS